MLPIRRPVALAWLAVLCGGLLAGATLAVDGWRRPGLPADAVALVGERTIGRAEWLRAVQSVEEGRGSRLDTAGRAAVLQRLVDEELLLQHALDSDFVRDDPGLRKTVIAALIDAATAGGAVDESEARALFEADPGYFSPQPRLRVRALQVPVGVAPPPAAALQAALREGAVSAPLQAVELPDAPLPLSQLAQRLGGSAAAALQHARPGALLGPFGDGGAQTWVLALDREAPAPRYEDVARAVRSELAHRQANAALERLLRELRARMPTRIADDARG